MQTENCQHITKVTSKSSQFYERAYRIIFLLISSQIHELEFTSMLQLCKPLPTSVYTEKLINKKIINVLMAKRLDVRDIRQFNADGIRTRRKNKYMIKEGIIRWGAETEDFYVERAKRLYTYEAVDRVILLSRKDDKIHLEKLTDDILKKSASEWRRAPDDQLIQEGKYNFSDNVEIIDSERRGESENVGMIQINLVSNLYFAANYYLSEIHKNPEELSMNLVRILAGLYPKEWKEKLPGDIPHYDPKDVFGILIQVSSDRALIEYFEFFRTFFTKKHWNIEEISKKLETLLKIETPTGIHGGLNDLHLILKIVHKSLSALSLSEVSELKSEIDNYFQIVALPERFTDMLFRKYQNLFAHLQKFEELSDFQDKLYFLEESRKKIRESEILVDDKFVQPFKQFYTDILKKWMDLTFEEGGKLLNRAFIEAELQTKRMILKEELLVSVNIKNIGIGPAEDIQIVLHDSPHYEIIGEKALQLTLSNEIGMWM